MQQKQVSPVSREELIKIYRYGLAHGLSLEQLEKKVARLYERSLVAGAESEVVAQKLTQNWIETVPAVVRYASWIIPGALVIVGLGLLSVAVLPIVSNLIRSPYLQASPLAAPIPAEDVLDVVPIVVATSQSNEVYSSPTMLDIQLDYTNLSNWFESPQPELASTDVSGDAYYIDIPKLNIEQARVEVGGTNLNKNLIQYPGTSEPGQLGSPVIFGHSVLRQFYNPSVKNPKRYNSIFSTIMTLKNGDEIFITYQGIKYTYIVRDKTEVKPEDTFILAQNYDAQLLKLVTCTPEGTYLRRGVITAQLVNQQNS